MEFHRIRPALINDSRGWFGGGGGGRMGKVRIIGWLNNNPSLSGFKYMNDLQEEGGHPGAEEEEV